ncbi:phosphoserine transaminase [Sandaracinobacter sp. RS1-74]|uniref:phosphoserine transaminase n=1 Tax=Sandaracinobacteroides sayramensis TaxID=2913411 RepID=UPI001EDA7791|nr:phosphoserine transaminase [Sandaracinobacteroides sayramensis]MCG2842535.1 phosphoserine transaminase [Sandaracinobacteroides sayramensis]
MTVKPAPVRDAHEKPQLRPTRAHFSSGPCAKRPGYDLSTLPTDSLGRSHRAKIGKSRLKDAIERTRAILGVPASHRIGIVPASDTGAYEMAMWSLLGARPVTALAWESFGDGWVTDAVKQLKLNPTVSKADYGHLPDLAAVDPSHDVLFTWNGTTSGVRVPNADWIADDREGLTLCDATSAAFAQALPFEKLDVVTFSWQKVLGGEGAHGILILSPRAVERLESYTPAWPLPKIFRLTKGGKLIEGIFEGETINTPSMLAVEDYLDALRWAESAGGLQGLFARADANAAALNAWVDRTPWATNLAADPATRSNTSVCIRIDGAPELPKAMATLLEKEGVAFDINGYRDAPPSLRIWCGATVDTADIEALIPWLDWAYATAKEA